MNQVYVNWKTIAFSLVSLFVLFMLSFASFGQGKNDRCENNCFETIIVEKQELADGCISYELKVSFQGKCSPALSHYSLDLGCGIVSQASNSENWPMELNSVDPTTGLGSLKVDEIQGFGDESSLKSFQVSFTFCPTSCTEEASCISPAIAYKAGQCVFRDTLSVSCTKPLEVKAESNQLLCAEDSNGEAKLLISGGELPYQIKWDNGSSDSLLINLTAGQYSYQVLSADSQLVEGIVEILAPDPININETLFLPTCQDADDGQIDVVLTGGIAPYSYRWSNGDTTASISSLAVGNYQLLVTDANGCSVNTQIRLSTSSDLEVSATIKQPSCGGGDGSIIPEVKGGTSPYMFYWSDGSTTDSLDSLSNGDYQLIVTDAVGCSILQSFSLEASSNLSLRAFTGNTNCNDDSIGYIDLNVYGGTAPFVYEWNNGATTEDIDGLVSGIYEVTVTDANGCQANASVLIRKRSPYIYGATQNVQCDQLGSIETKLYYTVGEVDYIWSTGDTTSNLYDLEAGIYTLNITDSSGCSTSRDFTIRETSNFSVAISIGDQSCDTTSTASLTATVNNGTAPYSYLWNTGDSIASIQADADGDYSVMVTDANGCMAEASLSYLQPTISLPSCAIISYDSAIQCGTVDNFLYTNEEGIGLTYQWTVNSEDSTWVITSDLNGSGVYYTAGTDSSSANFTLVITNEMGCSTSCTYEVSACISNGESEDNPEDNPDENPDDNPDDNPTDDPSDGEGEGDESGDDGTGGDGTGDNDGGSDGSGDDDGTGDNDEGGDGSEEGDGSDEGEGDDDGSDELPGNGSNNGDGTDKPCTDCFETVVESASIDNGVYEYTFKISVEGSCSYDLSHFTLALPDCIELLSYSNSEAWKMELVKEDPTTGLAGIKVDDIDAFKTYGDSFTLSIAFTTNDANCDLACWSPEVAYKAAQCVIYQEVDESCISQSTSIDFTVYPNPASDYININTTALEDDVIYTVSLYNDKGSLVSTLVSGTKEQISEPIKLPLMKAGETIAYYLMLTGNNEQVKVERIIIRR